MKLYFITLPHEKPTLFTFVNSLLIVKQNYEEKRGECEVKPIMMYTLHIATTHYRCYGKRFLSFSVTKILVTQCSFI